MAMMKIVRPYQWKNTISQTEKPGTTQKNIMTNT